MRYYIDAYDKGGNGELKQHITFESDKEFKGGYSVCDKLITYIMFGEDELIIPEGVTTLCRNFYIDDQEDIMDPDCTKLVLPASLTEIEPDTFEYMGF